MSASSTSDFKGTVRWMAPELLIFVDGEPSAHSETTDIWALGMVAYELLSGNAPYSNLKNDYAVIMAISKKRLPSKPMPAGDHEIFEMMWTFCYSCWKIDGKSRPTAEQAVVLWSTEPHARIDALARRNMIRRWFIFLLPVFLLAVGIALRFISSIGIE